MSRHPFQRRRAHSGSAYVLILSLSVVLSLIGFAGIAQQRLTVRHSGLEQGWHEAADLAHSAVDHALNRIAVDIWWRETLASYESNFTPETALGRGSFSWRIEDLADNDLNDNDVAPVRIHGRGRVGHAVRAYSVVAFPFGSALDVLRCAVHAGGELDVDDVLDVRLGPASSNALIGLNNGQIIGAAEALLVDVPANVTEGATFPVPAKTMPGAAVWAVYKLMATEIRYSDLPSGNLEHILISAASNPYRPDKTNSDGLYFIKIPAFTNLGIQDCRIEGTLAIELSDSASLKILPNVVWKPHRADYPALIAYTTKDTATDVEIDCSGQIDETSSGVNFNPPHTPFFGQSDADTADTYNASLRGLFHVIRNVATPSSRTKIESQRTIRGAIIADGEIRVIGPCRVAADPMLLANPPLGYTAAPAPANLLSNGDMESGLTAWSPLGPLTVLVPDGGAHSGAKRMTVKNRSAASEGIRQDVTGGLTNNAVFVSDVWLMMHDAPEATRISLEVDATGSGTQWFSATTPTIQKSSWTRAVVPLTVIWVGDLNYARWVVMTTTSNQEFRIDDALLTPLIPGPPAPRILPVPGTWQPEAVQ